MLSRRQFIKVAAAAMPAVYVSSRLSADEPDGRPPNIVYVFADQMRNCTMGCMGDTQALTPNLDKLAGEGLLLTNMVSSHPLCTPYRAQLMTGRYGFNTGVIHNDIRLPDDAAILPVQMKSAGYTTGYIGKWHLTGGPRSNPVDKINRRGWDFWAVRNCSHDHFNPVYWLNDATEPTRVAGWEPDVQTDLAVEFIKKHKQTPFCLMMSFGPPHNPYKAPESYTKKYPDDLKVRPNTEPSKGNISTYKQYYAMITSLDACVERISKVLDETGLARDTIFIFTSDHGDMLGSQGHQLKQRPWEESINVPYIMRYPRSVKAGQRRDWMLDSVDLMPTLLGFAGAKIPAGVQGMNQSALLLGSGREQREMSLIMNISTGGASPGVEWRGIRTKQWTYACHGGGDWVMYDNKSDPDQLKNLVSDSQYADRKAQLIGQLQGLRKQLGDTLPVVGDNPKPIVLPT